MIIKLTDRQYDFLRKSLSVERPELFKSLPDNNSGSFVIDEEIAMEIQEWASDKIQKEGFDVNYDLNETGKILQELEDVFYI